MHFLLNLGHRAWRARQGITTANSNTLCNWLRDIDSGQTPAGRFEIVRHFAGEGSLNPAPVPQYSGGTSTTRERRPRARCPEQTV